MVIFSLSVFIYGPKKGDGDDPWYDNNGCKQCKERLKSGGFRNIADKWKSKAEAKAQQLRSQVLSSGFASSSRDCIAQGKCLWCFCVSGL